MTLQKHARPLTAITVATVVALVAFVPSIASADRSTPAASAAAKKKKKKKAKPVIATVNGSFTIRYDEPGGYGLDEGPFWRQLKVVIKNAKIPLRAPNQQSGGAFVSMSFYYEEEAHTLDLEFPPGSCDRADIKISGKWFGWTHVFIRETNWLVTNGKSKKYLGWEVRTDYPSGGLSLYTISSHQDWHYWPLPGKCVTTEDNHPSPDSYGAFMQPRGLGKLSSDGRSVPLTAINTEVNQTGTVTGSIKFNTPLER